MRLALMVFFLSWATFAQGQVSAKPDLQSIRKAMVLAVDNHRVTDSLFKKIQAFKSKDGLILGYLATLEALKAKHSWNPYSKLKHISQASKWMQEAVNADPENVEIRFMRFSMQHFTPSFLGYSKNLEEDKGVILALYERKKFSAAQPELIASIARFMIQSKRCTLAEQQIFKKFA